MTVSNATAGGAVGYFEDSKVQEGESGTPVLQETETYFGHTDSNGNTVFVEATDTTYANTNGTGARTTTYGYTFYSGTNQINQMTTTLPTISSTENGPGTAAVMTTVYDSDGRVIWTKDAQGYITYTQYDPTTGYVDKTIQDVNTADTGDFSNLPAGWSTPSGGGLELITNTTYQTTATGSVIITEDPDGNVTYVVDDDVDHATFTFPGVTINTSASTMTTTGPSVMSRAQLTNGTNGIYSEALTFSGTLTYTGGTVTLPGFGGTTGNPSLLNLVGNATSGSQFTIQSLSRNLYNDSDQMVESDAYYKISDATYLGTSAGSAYSGTSTANFNATLYGYDSEGREDRVESSTGTIERTVYDDLGRVVSEWIGTDDTPTSGTWSPSNTVGTNMTMVLANQYDGGNVGDSNLTQTTQYGGGGEPEQRHGLPL